MKNQLENIILFHARKFFKSTQSPIELDSEGNFTFEVYTDYNDMLDENTINKAFELFEGCTEKIRDYLNEHIRQCYIDYISEMEMEFSKQVQEYIVSNVDSDTHAELLELNMLDVDAIRDILVEYSVLSITVDHSDILKRSDIDLVICLEGGVSKNHEFTLNNFNGDVLEWIEETKQLIEDEEISECDISLISLLKSQGFTLTDFENEALRYFNEEKYQTSNKFIHTLIDECYNTTSMCNALVALKRINLNDYLNGDTTSIKVIEKGTPCGYVDFIYGGGSVLNIVLDKDIQLSSIPHEKFADGSKYRYSIKEIYGEFFV